MCHAKAYGLALAATLVLATSARALEFDHLLGGKVRGGLRADRFTANLDAVAVYNALDGTGCSVTGAPRMMFVPVTMTPAAPHPITAPQLTTAHEDQVYVCYTVHCPSDSELGKPFRDELADHFNLRLASTGRFLCVPAVFGRDPCGDPADRMCGGHCYLPDGVTEDSTKQCMRDPADHDNCVCVDTPPCGQGDDQCSQGHCPPGFTCGAPRDSASCRCLRSCGTEDPECDGACPAHADCWDFGDSCGCVLECGKVGADEPTCSIGGCFDGKVCKGTPGTCSCQDP